MQQVTTPHWFQPEHGPERFMGGGAIVTDDDPAVSRNPGYFVPIEPEPQPQAEGDPPRRRTRRPRGG